MSTLFDQSATNLGQAQNTQTQVAQGGLPAQSMNSYINPHRSMVLDDTVGRLQDQFQMRLDQVGDQAQAGGAFGGARHGLVEGLAFDDYMRNVGEVSNQANQMGYDSALSAGFQDVGQRQAAANSLHGMGLDQYNLGRNVMNDQLSMGNMQQQLNQQILGQAGGWLDQYIGSPAASVGQLSAATQGSPLARNQTTSTNPGLFDYVGLGLQTAFGGMGAGK